MKRNWETILFVVTMLWFLLLALMLAGCATPPVPKHDAAVDQAWARFLLCELPPEHRPEGCE